MPRKVIINLTQRDLASKTENGAICEQCPVTRAVRRHKGFENAQVGYSYLRDDSSNILILLPNIAREFISNYGSDTSDRTNARPFSFTIEVPDGF